jgi:outer membrane protein assembly factor BamB
MVLHGKRQFVYCAIGGIAGVSAEGEDKGKILWTSSEWKPNVFAPSPVRIGDGRIFLTAGYGAGGAVLEVSKDSDKWTAKIRKSWKAKEGIACEQQTPIVVGSRLLSILPKDAGGMNSLMAAASLDGDCEVLFTSPRGTRFGIGPYLSVNGKILILDDNGKLYVLNMKEDSFEIESERKFFDGGDSWGPMAFSNGLLLLRDSEELACIDLRRDMNE